MPNADWERVKQVFDAVIEKTGSEREALLQALSEDDEELLSDVRALLAAHEAAGGFLEAGTVPGSAPSDLVRPTAQHSLEGPGTRVGPFKLLQLIGEGGFGAVYMAEQEEPIRRRVALKIVKPGMDSKQVIARFEAERQALAMLNHPNIASVYDAGTTESGRPYFVMELVRGVPITEFCDDNRLSTRERLQLFRDTCHAIHHAHQAGIIHRDVKPSNVLVTMHDGEPMPKVIDFGVAKATHHRLTEKTLFTEYSQFIGTPTYMSPEQAELGALDIDERTDVYSLGVLLYELLTGSTPLDAARLRKAAYLEMLHMLREEEPPKPSTRLSTLGDAGGVVARNRAADVSALAKLLSGDLDWIVMKALDKSRSRRYESAADLADDIDRYFYRDPVLARPPSVGYRMQKFVAKRRVPLAAAASIAATLAAAGSFVAWQTRAAAAPSAVTAAALGPGIRAVATSLAGWTGDTRGRIDREGRQLLVASPDAGVEAVDLATGERRVLVSGFPTDGSILPRFQQIDLSHDGQRVALVVRHESEPGAPEAVHLLDVGGAWPGTELTRASEYDSQHLLVGFSPNDDRIWLKRIDRDDGEPGGAEISSLDVGSGAVRTLVSVDAASSSGTPSLSPDGRFLADTRRAAPGAPGDVYVIATDGSSRYRIEHPAHDDHAVFAPDGSGVVFQSDRRGGEDLWFVELKDGRPRGEPMLVWPEAGAIAQIGVKRFTEDGSLVVTRRLDFGQRVVTASIDVEAGTIGDFGTLTSPLGGQLGLASYSPSGEFLAYVRGISRLVVRDLESNVEREFPIRTGYVYEPPRWCADSRSLVFAGIAPVLQHVSLDEGWVHQVDGHGVPGCSGDGAGVVGPRWTGDDYDALVRYDFESGLETVLLDGPFADVYGAPGSLSPSGTRVAVVLDGPESSTRSVVVVPTEGGEPFEVLSEPTPRGGGPRGWLRTLGWASEDEVLVWHQSDADAPASLWVVPVDGRPVVKLERVGSTEPDACAGGVWGFTVHPDRRRLAYHCRTEFRARVEALDGLMDEIDRVRSME